MNVYKVFIGGTKDSKGNYVGGRLDSTWRSERKAFERKRELNFSLSFKDSFIIYVLREGDEVFAISQFGNDMFSVNDKETGRVCYGICKNYDEAAMWKRWCEKFCTLGWYY